MLPYSTMQWFWTHSACFVNVLLPAYIDTTLCLSHVFVSVDFIDQKVDVPRGHETLTRILHTYVCKLFTITRNPIQKQKLNMSLCF